MSVRYFLLLYIIFYYHLLLPGDPDSFYKNSQDTRLYMCATLLLTGYYYCFALSRKKNY